MALYLHTSGVMGLKDVLKTLHDTAWGNFVDLNIKDLVDGDAVIGTDTETSLIINLAYPWTREQLKTPYETCPEYANIKAALIEHIVSPTANWPAGLAVHLVGHEYGLGFVPMQPGYREEIRRATDLQSAIVKSGMLDRYTVYFAGGSSIRVI